MIPPLVLQVEPHHLTLDMCAAPGSKTTQMLEVIQRTAAARAAEAGAAVAGEGVIPVAGEPTGMVMANDSDTQRAYMLAHQCNSQQLFDSCSILTAPFDNGRSLSYPPPPHSPHR